MRKERQVCCNGMLIMQSVLIYASFIFIAFLLFSAPFIGASQRAGTDDCMACHEEQVTSFENSIHGKKGFELNSDRACMPCHGPGEEHVDSDGNPQKIGSFTNLNSEEKSETCLPCHDKGDRMYWMGSAHSLRGLACQDCHSIHNARTKEAQLTSSEDIYDVCFQCHKQKASQFFRASHHPIREGKVICSDCHNPHGSENPRLIEAQTINEKCFECHTEKRGPFLWDHQPVREDCMICHDPHGTNHFKMVKTIVPYICQRRHADGGHPSGLYDQSQIDSLLPFTINSALTADFTGALEFPAATANAKANVSSFNLTVNSKIAKKVYLNAGFRIYHYANKTPVLEFENGYGQYDYRWVDDHVAVEPLSFGRSRLYANVSFNLLKKASFNIGYDLSSVERKGRAHEEASEAEEKDKSKEGTFKASLDTQLTDWMLLRLSYINAKRKWSLEGIQEIYLPDFKFKRFFQADRDRDALNVLVDLFFIENFGLILTYMSGKDRYPNSEYGLLKDDFSSYSLDLSYAISEALLCTDSIPVKFMKVSRHPAGPERVHRET